MHVLTRKRLNEFAENEQTQPESSARATAGPLRWLGAVICIVYGFAKLNQSQFTVLDSELARPLGEVSGFWLTWYYFGYSAPYGTFIALVQIVGGLLLVWYLKIVRTSTAVV